MSLRKARRDDKTSQKTSLLHRWKEYASPDGSVYYYNAKTKESRWDLPDDVYQDNDDSAVNHATHGHIKFETVLETKQKTKKEKQTREKSVSNPSTVMFLKLQASLGERLEAIHTGPRRSWNSQQEEVLESRKEGAGHEVKTSLNSSLEKQYETETAAMSAAERLRFLRKKRQESMMSKRDNMMEDDFMMEVANNMKKKGVIGTRREGHEGDATMSSWKKQEAAEEERKQRQMQQEMEMKKQMERKERHEQECAKQIEEERCKQEKTMQQEEENRKKGGKNDEEISTSNGVPVSDCYETSSTRDVQIHSSIGQRSVEKGDENLDVLLSKRVKHRRNSRSDGKERGSFVNRQADLHVESVEGDTYSVDDKLNSRIDADVGAVQDEKHRLREERRARKELKKKLLVTSKLISVTLRSPQRELTSSLNDLNEECQTWSTSSIEVDKDAKAREKQLRRERRRMAKMEAALAAQDLAGAGRQEDTQFEKCSEPHPVSKNGPTIESTQASGYPPMSGQPPLCGGMYPAYPYMMMMPPPAPPCGYYYPYMQPYSMPMPMYPPDMVPPGHQSVAPGYHSMPPILPHLVNGTTVASSLIPYGTESTLTNAYGMNGGSMPSSPHLSTCDCCKGTGVGLVEKNGVCAHCNRLRLAFIVDSSQMRRRCSICGGWGSQLLHANGVCAHCTRGKYSQPPQRMLSAVARRPSSVATTVAGDLPRQFATTTKIRTDGFDDMDWDQSSSNGSDWDD